MGCGVPYGLAAKLAHPDRPVVVLAGDGAIQMSGLAELVTVAAPVARLGRPRFVVCVLDNGDLAEVSWEQRETEGEPRFDASQDLPSVPYARWAELLGLQGIRVTRRPTRWPPPGTRPWPPTGPSSSTCTSTRRCRCCRRS